MRHESRMTIRAMWTMVALAATLAALACPAWAYVVPSIGGGQVTADMEHIGIWYDQTHNIMYASVDNSSGIPQLTPLSGSDAFDPATAWGFIGGQPYNWQYGWNIDGPFTIPTGAAIWIKLLSQSDPLSCYDGRGNAGTYAPIFGTGASGTLWKWSTRMTHNTYVAPSNCEIKYSATYDVYFGDANTGSRASYMQYADATVTLNWTAQHPGDSNDDGRVDVIDLGVLATNYDGTGMTWQQADFNGDGAVDVIDLGVLATNYDWVSKYYVAPAGGGPAVPEPGSAALLAMGALVLLRRSTRKQRFVPPRCAGAGPATMAWLPAAATMWARKGRRE
jgi:hypothetical protein